MFMGTIQPVRARKTDVTTMMMMMMMMIIMSQTRFSAKDRVVAANIEVIITTSHTWLFQYSCYFVGFHCRVW
jgi:hypothetical protein